MRRTFPIILKSARLLILLLVAFSGACSKSPDKRVAANIDYWTCAMHPSVHSESPGICPICGMELVPIWRERAENIKPGEFLVPPGRQQQIGVTYAEVRRGRVHFDIRSLGTLDADQARVFECVSRVEGYVEAMDVTSPGQRVGIGQPLMKLYSPDLRGPEQELLNLLKAQSAASGAPATIDLLLKAARHRLQLLNVDPIEISEIERTGQLDDTLVFRSAFEGVVSEVPVKVGRGVKPGDKLMSLVNLSELWLWVSFYENEVGLLKEGQQVKVTLPAVQNQSFDGKIAVISPTIDPVKRTAMVRVDLPNPEGQLRPGMYANVLTQIDAGESLIIPADAVLPTGERMLVFVGKEEGRLEPRFIQVGRVFTDLEGSNQKRYYQVISGLAEGERIVSSGNFLIDSEARIQGALRDFKAASPSGN